MLFGCFRLFSIYGTSGNREMPCICVPTAGPTWAENYELGMAAHTRRWPQSPGDGHSHLGMAGLHLGVATNTWGWRVCTWGRPRTPGNGGFTCGDGPKKTDDDKKNISIEKNVSHVTAAIKTRRPASVGIVVVSDAAVARAAKGRRVCANVLRAAEAVQDDPAPEVQRRRWLGRADDERRFCRQRDTRARARARHHDRLLVIRACRDAARCGTRGRRLERHSRLARGRRHERHAAALRPLRATHGSE